MTTPAHGIDHGMKEFLRRFPDEKACREYLAALKWPDGFRCPRCAHDRAWITQRGIRLCKKCKYHCSITVGTFFEQSRLTLHQWFKAIYLWSRPQSISAKALQRQLHLGSYQTAWKCLHKLQTTLADALSGEQSVGEMDGKGYEKVLNRIIQTDTAERTG